MYWTQIRREYDSSQFDDDTVDFIYSESFDTAGIGSAIMNRLLKAAGHHVEKLV